jgi:hypothetical protein
VISELKTSEDGKKRSALVQYRIQVEGRPSKLMTIARPIQRLSLVTRGTEIPDLEVEEHEDEYVTIDKKISQEDQSIVK